MLFNATFEGSKITRFTYEFSAVRPGSKRVRNLFQVCYVHSLVHNPSHTLSKSSWNAKAYGTQGPYRVHTWVSLVARTFRNDSEEVCGQLSCHVLEKVFRELKLAKSIPLPQLEIPGSLQAKGYSW